MAFHFSFLLSMTPTIVKLQWYTIYYAICKKYLKLACFEQVIYDFVYTVNSEQKANKNFNYLINFRDQFSITFYYLTLVYFTVPESA